MVHGKKRHRKNEHIKKGTSEKVGKNGTKGKICFYL